MRLTWRCRYEPPWHKKLPSFRSLNTSQIESIMNDPSWTKAIFFRDPSRRYSVIRYVHTHTSLIKNTHRLLSAWYFMFKNGQGSQTYTLKRHLAKLTGNHSSTWPVFLDAVLSPEFKFQDVHWRPQVGAMGRHGTVFVCVSVCVLKNKWVGQ